MPTDEIKTKDLYERKMQKKHFSKYKSFSTIKNQIFFERFIYNNIQIWY